MRIVALLTTLACTVLLATTSALPAIAADAPSSPSTKPAKASPPAPPVCNRVRFFPAHGAEQAMVGGKFTGSNVSRTEGFVVLAQIKTAPPAGQWTELTFDNSKIYRWLRYEAPQGAHLKVAELEFYDGDRKLSGKGVGYGPAVPDNSWQNAFDEKTNTFVESELPDGQYVGIDLHDAATARWPHLDPAPGEYDGAQDITIRSTPGATIRYTLDGTMPTADHGMVYSAPLHFDKTATVQAIAFLPDRAPSPPVFGTYLIGQGDKPVLYTFHVGNSLTQTTGMFGQYCQTAGHRQVSKIFGRPGAWTKELWDIGLTQEKARWESLWGAMPRVDHFTMQPRDFDIAEEAGYDIKFMDLVRQKSPDMQPWLYCEWVERKRQRPTDLGKVPSSEMHTLYPALTWEESMSAMLLYVEEVQLKVRQSYKEGKPPRVLPTALIMGWTRHFIDHDEFPGLRPGSFYSALFNDQVHPSMSPVINANANGGFIVDMTWYSAFYRESPEGKVLPLGTTFTPEQAGFVQKLAWDVIKNYPDCGLYEEGTDPAAKPEFSRGPAVDGVTPVELKSTTPGAWFRYTLDGTTPTRTRGYVYCGRPSVSGPG